MSDGGLYATDVVATTPAVAGTIDAAALTESGKRSRNRLTRGPDGVCDFVCFERPR
jgi:hypothetical protein